MRIMMISDHADPLASAGAKEVGGQNIYVFYLANFLSKLGLSVDVYTRWDRRNKKQIVEVNSKFRVIRIKAGPKHYMPRDNFINVIDEFSTNVLKIIEREKLEYNVIHSNYWFSGLIGLNIRKRIKIPQVHVYHSIGQIRFDTLKSFKMQKSDYEFFQNRIKEEARIAREVTTVIATSPVEEKIIEELFKISPQKIKMISEGVDTKIFHPIKSTVARKKIGLKNGEKVLLYVGRIEWRKGIATLLFAMRDVLAKFPSVKLMVVGGGKTKASQKLDEAERNRLKRIVHQLRLDDYVQFVGAVGQDNLANYYSSAEVAVVPSYYEPFGIVPLEAMACGTPVVASKTGGLKYTVKDKITGFLAEPRTPAALAEKINLALSQGKKEFSENCLARIQDLFTWEKIASQYPPYFEKITK